MVVLGALAIFLISYLVMYLWNWLLPEIFGVPDITFIQALGLLILSKLLFGTFQKCGDGHHHHGAWRNKFKERYQQMSEEEKKRFRDRFGRYCQSYQCSKEEDNKNDRTGKNGGDTTTSQ